MGYDNVLRIEKASGARPQVIQRLVRTRATFLEVCAQQPEAVRTCLAEAQDRAALEACAWKGDGVAAPNPALHNACEAVYDNMMRLVAAEKPPEHVIQRMKDRREQGVAECTREPRALIDCLARAQSMGDLRACRRGPNAPSLSPEHRERCGGVYDRLLGPDGPTDIPKPFRDRWTPRRDRFIDECAAMPKHAITCMEKASAFTDYRDCIPAPEENE